MAAYGQLLVPEIHGPINHSWSWTTLSKQETQDLAQCASRAAETPGQRETRLQERT